MADHISPENFMYVENGSEIEMPDSFLPDRPSRAMCLYDIAELYEKYMRRTWLPRFSWNEELAGESYVKEIGSRLDFAGSSYGPDYYLDSTVNRCVDAFFDFFTGNWKLGHRSKRDVGTASWLFLDPDVELPSSYEYPASSGRGATKVDHTTQWSAVDGDYTYTYHHTGTGKGDLTRAEVPEVPPFRALSEADGCADPKTVTLSTGHEMIVPTTRTYCPLEELEPVKGPDGDRYVSSSGATAGYNQRYVSPLATLMPRPARTFLEDGSERWTPSSADLGTGPSADMSKWPFGQYYSSYAKLGLEYDSAVVSSGGKDGDHWYCYGAVGIGYGKDYFDDHGLPESFGDGDDMEDALKVFVPPAPDLVLPYFMASDGTYNRFPPNDSWDPEDWREDNYGVDTLCGGRYGSMTYRWMSAFPYRQPLDSMDRFCSEAFTRTLHVVHRYEFTVAESVSYLSRYDEREDYSWYDSESEGGSSTYEDWNEEETTGTRYGSAVNTANGSLPDHYAAGPGYVSLPSPTASLSEVVTLHDENYYTADSTYSSTDYSSSWGHSGTDIGERKVTCSHSLLFSRFRPCQVTQATGGIDMRTSYSTTTRGKDREERTTEHDQLDDTLAGQDIEYLVDDDHMKFVKGAHLYAMIRVTGWVSASGSTWEDSDVETTTDGRSGSTTTNSGYRNEPFYWANAYTRRYVLVDLGEMGEDGYFDGEYDPYSVLGELSDTDPVSGCPEGMTAQTPDAMYEGCDIQYLESHEVYETSHGESSSTSTETKTSSCDSGSHDIYYCYAEIDSMMMVVDWDFDIDWSGSEGSEGSEGS